MYPLMHAIISICFFYNEKIKGLVKLMTVFDKPWMLKTDGCGKRKNQFLPPCYLLPHFSFYRY